MRQSIFLLLVLTATLVVTPNYAWQDGKSSPASEDGAAEVYDHHVHVMSPALIGHWKALGVPFSREDSAYSDSIQILESQNLAGAFLVSMAHMYTTEDLAGIDDIGENEQSWVAKENDYVAESVARAPTKLVGFFSVNPLRDYSLEELERCRGNTNLTGLKLHLPACGVDLTDSEHQAMVAKVFDWAIEHDVPMLVHLFGADEDDPQALAELFWKRLIQPRDSIDITLAHLGAAGGFNDVSEAVISGFDALRAADPMFRTGSGIRFDLSGAILAEETDGIPATSDERCRALSKLIQQIGPGRFLFASDYPVFSTESTVRTLREKLTLTDDELKTLLENKSNWFAIKREVATISHPEIRLELLRRVAIDQKMRRGLDGKTFQSDPEYFMKLTQVDKENREWLAPLVEQHGWLGRSKVGKDGARAAWLLVQHADMDRKFQNRCLELMTAMGPDEVNMANVAYLTDRVLVGQGKLQRYGTQFGMSDGELKMQECEDPDNLDKRRKEVGLGTIAEYKEVMQQAYENSLPKKK